MDNNIELILDHDSEDGSLNLNLSQEDVPLTPLEKKQVSEFASKIDIKNSSQILNYGTAAQKKLDLFSSEVLSEMRTNESSDASNILADLVSTLKDFKFENDLRGVGSFFRKIRGNFTKLKAKYDTVDKNVQTIAGTLEKHQLRIKSDIISLDKMFDANLQYLKELTMYIMAGKERLHLALEQDLPNLKQHAKETGLMVDAQAANDFADLCNRFDKRLYDLKLTRSIAIQMGPQIRLVQKTDSDLSDKIQSTLSNTIPLWRNQMYLNIVLKNSSEAIEAQKQATGFTNILLHKNADALKEKAIEVAKASEGGIVDLETLISTNESLILTLDEILSTQREYREKRQAAENELVRIEEDLKNKMIKKGG